MLLEGGKAAEAQAIFLEELRRNPDNGCSLFGLEQALRAQGKKKEAGEVADRFQRAWKNADVELKLATL